MSADPAGDGAKSYDGTSFFGGLLDRATNIGQSYLDYDWRKFVYNSETSLANNYRTAVENQAAVDRSDITAVRNDNMVKYGIMAVVGLVAVLAVVKAVK